MADRARQGDLQVQIVNPDNQNPADIVYLPDETYALRVKADITGTSGTLPVLNRATRIETNKVTTSSSTWHTVLDLTVTTGYTWYLKGLILATERNAEWRLKVNSVVKVQGRLDASDSLEVQLYGFEVAADTDIDFEMNCGATNQDLFATLIIYEEENT